MKLIGHPIWLPSTLEQKFPSLTSNVRTQIAIIGGSYSALSTAYFLAKQGYNISLLEADLIGKAGSRSSGILCSSLERDFIDYVNEYGFERAKRYWLFSVMGVKLIKEILEEIDQQNQAKYASTGSLYVANKMRQTYMQKETFLRQRAGFDAQYVENFNNPLFQDGGCLGIITKDDSTINPYLFSRCMVNALIDMGVKVYESSKILEIDKKRGICFTKNGQIKADKIYLAGQNIPKQFGFRKNQLSILTFCLATEPLSNNLLTNLGLTNKYSFWDAEMPFLYGRVTENNQLIIGGEDLWEPLMYLGLAQSKLSRLEQQFRQRIPQLKEISVTHRWGGPLYITIDAMPTIGESGRLVFAGNSAGISQAITVGKIISGLMSDFTDLLNYKREISAKMFSSNEIFSTILSIVGIK